MEKVAKKVKSQLKVKKLLPRKMSQLMMKNLKN
jgi:hypothetical protein